MRKSVLSAVAMMGVIMACAETTEPSNSFGATLRGSQVVPPVTTAATGTATFTVSGTNLNYTVTWTGLSAAPTAIQLHVGAAGANLGTPRAALCGTGGASGCPAVTSTTAGLTGVIAPANVIGSPGFTMDSLLVQMRNFNAHVAIVTPGRAAGEIRGQLVTN
jgi:hypothetical protein